MRKRKEWAFRLHWESKDHSYGWFSLLTYTENAVPWLDKETGEIFKLDEENPFGEIDLDRVSELYHSNRYETVPLKSDIQLFLKRLRSEQKYHSKKQNFENTNIRYYIVSEYGEHNTERPHYHAVLFGVHPYVRDRMVNHQKVWKNGIATARHLETSSPKGFMYMTKYLFKQQNIDAYPIRPFQLMSKKPYIGKRFEDYALQSLKKSGDIDLKDGDKWESIPRIYKEKLPFLTKKQLINGKRLRIQEDQEKILHYCEKNGKKDPDLLEMEKKAYYNKEYELELLTMKNKYNECI